MSTTTWASRLLAPSQDNEAVGTYIAARAASVDACEASPRESIAHLATLDLLEQGVLGASTPEQFLEMSTLIGTVAFNCMSQAFSIWCHRMAIEYLHQADAPASDAIQRHRDALRRGEILGSTSFASATAHYLAGTPLTLSFRETPAGLTVNGRISWASNLQAPFVSVAAAVNEADAGDRRTFLYTEDTPGLQLPSYPALLALQATSSTSPAFADALIPADHVLTRDFEGFVGRVLATFLVLQSSFCWGLAVRAQAESAALLNGPGSILSPVYDDLHRRLEEVETRLRTFALHERRDEIEHRDLIQLRFDLGQIACESVALESKLTGGRGYMLQSGTARRLREAAFLPIQAPTEIQLRWLLTRFA